jgi:hypothetical protein
MDGCDTRSGCSHVRPTVLGAACGMTIDVSAGGTFSGDSTCAGDEVSAGCGGGDAPDVFLRFTLSAASDVVIDTVGTGYDAVLALGTTCGGSEVTCDDNGGGATAARIARTALGPGTYYVALDGKPSGTGGAWRASVSITRSGPTSEVVSFPSPSDATTPSHGYLWNAGNFVEGARTTGLTPITSLDMHLVPSENLLTCDTQDMRLMVNGSEVGRFSVTASGGTSPIDRTFAFGALAGPSYTFRIECTRPVAGGCGSARLARGASTLTIRR